jgi:hypothetical protein
MPILTPDGEGFSMRKILIAGVSALVLGLSSAAFANSVTAGSGGTTTGGDTAQGVSGSTGGMVGTVAGRTSTEFGTGSDTTSQREACPPGDVEVNHTNCIKPVDQPR